MRVAAFARCLVPSVSNTTQSAWSIMWRSAVLNWSGDAFGSHIRLFPRPCCCCAVTNACVTAAIASGNIMMTSKIGSFLRASESDGSPCLVCREPQQLCSAPFWMWSRQCRHLQSKGDAWNSIGLRSNTPRPTVLSGGILLGHLWIPSVSLYRTRLSPHFLQNFTIRSAQPIR